MTSVSLLAIAIGALLCVLSATAHHSFASYDLAHPVTVIIYAGRLPSDYANDHD